jgi:hypothetical protein
MGTIKRRRWLRPLSGLDDHVAQRFGVWLAVASVVSVACYWFGLGFPEKLTGDLLGARLALLGLVGAIATFQYGTWMAIATRSYQEINNPAWIQFEADLNRDIEKKQRTGEPAADIAERSLALEAWHAWREQNAKTVLKFTLPHNRITLTNYLASAYLLLLSTIADLMALLLPPVSAFSGALSAGAFLASLGPFIDVWRKYIGAVCGEFQGWERNFQGAVRKPDNQKEGRS